MNSELKNIENLLIRLEELYDLRWRINRTEYKCENYEGYKKQQKETRDEIIRCKKQLEKECNEYIKYPTRKILFIDITPRVKIRYDDVFGETITIPPINKREYFCLTNLLQKMLRSGIGRDTYYLKE